MVGLIAIAVIIGEIETGTGQGIVREVVKAWEMPELGTSAGAVADVVLTSVNIRCSHAQPPGGNGSGTLIHKWGRSYVLTAAHVVECEAEGEDVVPWEPVYLGVYQGSNEWRARLVAYDPEYDLALLRLEDVGLVGRTTKFFNPHLVPPVGTKLLHVGNLLGRFSNSFSEGVLARLDSFVPISRQPLDQITTVIYPGSSGGGVFTADGRYAGTAVISAGPGLHFMVPVRQIYAWASKNDVPWIFE